jgi:hypothetical protein
MPHLPSPPSTILGLGPSTCTPVRLRGAAATLPSAVAGSPRYAWLNHGRPFIHTSLSVDHGSAIDVRHPIAAGHISILDGLPQFVGPTVVGQHLQHNDAPNAALTYGVGHRLRCFEPYHA